jgi:hypothetical protein
MSRPRRATSLAALYAVPAAAWVVVARGLVPPIIRDAYHGRSLPPLNRVFQRRIPHPVEHYLDLWRAAWQAILLAWLFHLIVVLVVLATDRRLGEGRSPEDRRRAGTIDRWLIAFALAFLLFTVLSGPRHDYVAFLEIWAAVRGGSDPWWIHERFGYPLNAYGPLFNLLALPAWCNPLAPKLLFALAYCLFAAIFLKGGMARPGPLGFPAMGLLAWLLGPFPWVEIAYYGHFDVLVAIACVAAVAFVLRGREVLAGASLAVGFLLKLIPVVIVPFFALDVDGRRVRSRFLAGAGIPMVLGYVASDLIWGRSTFRPFAFAATRGSTLLSIFRFLRGGASPLRRFMDHPDLDAWSTRCLAVAGLLAFLACRWRRADPATSALVAVLTTLLFYQVGFIQYQMILFLLMAYWLGRYGPLLGRHPGLAFAIGGYFGWLSLFDLFYCYAGGIMQADGPWGWVADRVGLPTFLLGSFLLANLLRVAGRLPGRTEDDPRAVSARSH